MPDDSATPALALFHQGEQHLQSGALADAAEAFEQALRLDAGFAEAHANLGYVRDQQGQAEEAEHHYRLATSLASDNPTVHLNLGALLAQQKRHAEAEASYAAALALDPHSSALWSNLGVLNLNRKVEDTAEACLRHAIALDPGNAKARFNLAYLQLRHGRFEEGWALFESRDWYQALAERFAFARWQGELLAGRALLAVCEAGHGDVIQFCRYIPVLKALGSRHVALLCHPALQRLIGSVQGLDAVYSLDGPLPDAGLDFWMPLMSAPFHLQSHVHTLPAQLPYLAVDPACKAHWQAQLAPTQHLRVGLVWKGNPAFENDADRSLPHLSVLAPLWQVPGLEFFSLQKGAGESEIAACASSQPLVDLGSRMQDFADAAAILEELDLLISVDTAMAHLAGALGKPCWLLLPWYMTDWRWGAAGSTTPWYPNALRLFRQGPEDNWSGVITELQLALLERSRPQGAPHD